MIHPGKPLILVKHSLPAIEEDLPAREWRLSEQGRIRAQRLAQRLGEFQPEVVVCSHEAKAQETGEIIARAHQLELHAAENLHEHDRSNVPYLRRDEFQDSMQEFFAKPDRLVLGQETANQSHARFEQAVRSVLDSHGNKTIAIVAHGTVISLFVSRLTGVSDLALWKELGLPSFLVIDLHSNRLIAKENID